jgi:hypothetical protein
MNSKKKVLNHEGLVRWKILRHIFIYSRDLQVIHANHDNVFNLTEDRLLYPNIKYHVRQP